MEPSNEISTHKAARVDYVDWLRVVTTLCVFVFHSARFFDTFSDWHVKNGAPWIGGNIIVAFMSLWIMPMFMVLAGASTYYSLQSRSAWQYIRERVLRLLVPFLFGVLVVVAPQRYYELLYRGKLSGANLLEFYSSYLLSLPRRFAHFGFYHLWFLALLFIFSLVCLPLFMNRSKKGVSPLAALASGIDCLWKLMLLLVLSLGLIDVFVYPGTLWGNRDAFGGWCLVAHLLFFISGYMIFASPGMAQQMGRVSRLAGIGIVVSAIVLMPLVHQMLNWKHYFGSAAYGAAQMAQAVLSWCLLISFINLGRWVFNFKNRFLAYASEAVLPFYILHQTVIIIVGSYVVRWELSPPLKYLVIVLVSFTLIITLYDLLIRRINVLRFLFGMRAIRKTA
jgi:peptidoglycan/LPS O-acetylase OafA/YrhL